MSRVLYLDCSAGASGDMVLGALVDAGLPLDELRLAVGSLPLGGFSLEARKVRRAGLVATKVDVVVAPEAHHHHRGLSDILELLGKSRLEPEVAERCAALFRRLGEAEAAVHGTTVEEVHFHEVGAVDSIVDVVGSVWGLHRLGASRTVASPLNVGSGTVRMAHGVFPVPAPATVRLVDGVPVFGDGEGEMLTPTGALIVTGHARSYGPLPRMRPTAVGYGAGSREGRDRPNVLRLVVGEEDGPDATDRVAVLEATVDDNPPQLLGTLMDRLFAQGALDVWYAPVQMKKGRPGIVITVLGEPASREALEETLFRETTTLGVRWIEWERTVLERESVPVETPYGTVRVKVGRRGGRLYNAQPELEDCARAATGGIPVKEVWAAALSAWRALPGSTR